jgi:prepilin-type N-terminal cleavage/methylation domain-containing protein
VVGPEKERHATRPNLDGDGSSVVKAAKEHTGMIRRRHGFTLIELLVVIAIIAILAACPAPALAA